MELTFQSVERSSSVARRVLVVEDDIPTARALASVLRHAGYEPVVCHSAAQALRSAGQHLPDVALIDLHLPDMSGLILTGKLRQLVGQEVPLIVVSGDTSMEMLNSLHDAGATYFLSKPMSPIRMLQLLEDHLSPDATAV